MARIFNTSGLSEHTKLSPDEVSWIYNGLDCCVTAEVRGKLAAQLASDEPNVKETYATAMRKFAPVNFMCMTGLRVDEASRQSTIRELKREIVMLNRNFDKLMHAAVDYTINWRSPVQLKSFFYDSLRCKVKRKRNAQGNFVPTVNAEALEAFCLHPFAEPFARYILAMREIAKRISFLETEVDTDGRMRTSLNIAGTDTGRFASSLSSFGTGSNLQNVENQLRRVFVPDPGYIFVNVDLEQADARGVGARIWQAFYDSHGPEAAGKFLDAAESGDLHTTVCAMAWQELDWPEPWDLKAARAIADQIFYRHFSYRDMAKRLGHGTNFFGTPRTMAMHTKTEQAIIESFQLRYFNAFPLIGSMDKELDKVIAAENWHGWVLRELRDKGSLTTLFGRRRIFFDRWKDANTLRAAIAYEPQSLTGEFLDRGWLNLWDNMPEAKLQIPVHDSILFQLPYEGLHELLPRALSLLQVSLPLVGDRTFTIPLEAKTGYNWADSVKDKKTGLWTNELGLRKWTGKEEREPPRKRTRLRHYLS